MIDNLGMLARRNDLCVPAEARTIRVKVHATHPLVSAGLHAVLREHDDIQVVDTGSEDSALRAGDVIVAESTHDACRPNVGRPSSGGQSLPVVAIDDGGGEYSVVAAVRNGIRGVVSSKAVQSELPDAVRAVARGQAYLSSDMAGLLLDWLSRQLPDDLFRFTRAVTQLSAREREVLLLVGGGQSNAEIAGRLVISETTVRSHIYHLLTKLDLRTRTQAVLFGYQFRLSSGPDA